MIPRVKIGILADADMRLYEFTRNTRLPRDTFRSEKWDGAGDLFAVVVAVGGFLLALFCGWGGQ